MAGGSPPPNAANGWFHVSTCDEIGAGDVRPLSILSRELVLYRDAEGEAHVLDAFCPHLGAHLGFGGRVEGRDLRCPFHAWLWGPDGRCREIPYAKKIPARAQIRVWTVAEKGGLLFLWHHAGDEPPNVELPDLPEAGSADWAPWRARRWTVRGSFQEIREALAGGSPDEVDEKAYGPALRVARYAGEPEALLLRTATPLDEESTAVSVACSVRASAEADTTAGSASALFHQFEERMETRLRRWGQGESRS